MGSRVVEPLQGVLKPDSRFSLDTLDLAASDVSPASPRPGIAVADDHLAVALPLVEENQGAGLELVALDAERWGYRLAGDVEADVRGWDTPAMLTGCGALAYSTSSNRQYHDCVTLRNGTVFAAYSSGGTVSFVTFDPSDRSVSSISATVPTVTSTDHLALEMGPEGRVYCVINDQVWTADESDSYATWTQRSLLPYSSAAGAPDGQRAIAYGAGGWVMFAWSSTDYEQWASLDGVRWRTVEDVSSVGDLFDVKKLPDGTFLVAYRADTTLAVTVARIGSAWEALSSVVGVTLSASFGVALAVYQNGTAYCYSTNPSSGVLQLSRSTDFGASWTSFDTSSWRTSSQVYWKNLRACVVHGLVYLQGQHQSGTNPDTSVWWATCGGWSQCTVGPRDDETQRDGFGSSSRIVWNGFELPDASGIWTATTVGSPTVTLVGGDMRHACPSGQQKYYTRGTLGTSTQAAAHWVIRAYDGPLSATASQGAFVRLGAADGADDYSVEIQIGDLGYRVFDRHASSQLATVTVSTTGGLEWRACVDDGEVSVWHRTPGSAEWTLGVDAVATSSDTGSPAAFSESVFGTRAQTPQCDWGWVATALWGRNYFEGLDALGRELPSPGQGVGIPDGGTSTGPARLAALGGAGVRGQSWTVAPAYDYPVDAVFPSVASPAKRLRVEDKSEVNLVFDLGSSTVLGRAPAMYLDSGGTFRTAYLEYSTNGTSWTTYLTYDAATGWDQVKYSLAGDIVTPGATGGAGGAFYLHRRAAVGAYVDFGSVARAVVDHDSGVWAQGAVSSQVKPRLRVAGITGSETGSKIDIVWPRGWVVGHTASAPLAARFWRLRIPANQVTPYSYYELRTLVIGEVVVWGAQSAWGWSESASPSYRENRSRRGSTIRRKTGPTRRTWEHPWDPMEWWVDTDDPDWMSSSVTDALPLAAAGEVYTAQRGLLDYLDSGAAPLVALRHIPTEHDVTVVDPDRFLWGHLTSAPRCDQVVGDDDTAGQQMGRAASWVVEEAV